LLVELVGALVRRWAMRHANDQGDLEEGGGEVSYFSTYLVLKRLMGGGGFLVYYIDLQKKQE
jgi:hypothetical protein